MPPEVLPRMCRNGQVFIFLILLSLLIYVLKRQAQGYLQERTHWRRRSETLTLSSGDLAQ